MIAIIDTGVGNFRSVANAFEFLGEKVVITDSPVEIRKAERLVLPGVGSFAAGMQALKTKKLDVLLTDEVMGSRKKPFLGICLGMQLLTKKGDEGGVSEGLGWIDAETVRLENLVGTLRLPHVGWNDVYEADKKSRLFEGIEGEHSFYFVHSYQVKLQDKAVVSTRCRYGNEFVATFEKDNIAAVQFHPEKSHKTGLALLKNFVEKF